ncbi:MAG: hypothetical protein IPH43_04070 [Xanthomonadales bacterium]|nr:hypothetical protein [Xanthomonadales bacterium]
MPGAEAKIEAPAAGDPLLDLLDGSVADVVGKLTSVSALGLDQLEAAEKDGKTRKGVLTGLTEERLRRASFQPTAEQIAELQQMSEEKLQEMEDGATADGYLRAIAAIAAERARRAAEGDNA